MGGGGGGGGGEGGRGVVTAGMNTQHIVMTSSTELYSFMKIILTVFKIESKLQLKQLRGNNSESMQARVVIPVCDTSS